MKKFLAILLSMIMMFSIYPTVFGFQTDTKYLEKYSVSSALSDPDIYNYLITEEDWEEFQLAQDGIRKNQYEMTANNITQDLTSSSRSINYSSVDSNDVQQLTNKYGLQLPSEHSLQLQSENANVIDNGTMYVERNSLGKIIDIFYIYYIVTDYYFSVNAALIDADNPLDNVSGFLSRDYLNLRKWEYQDYKTFNKSFVRNGTICTWYVSKWAVKERFEYGITVKDNGLTHYFNNTDKTNYIRYNFAANKYNSLSTRGGQRHHFVAASALKANGYNTNTAYCIRMMFADHILTPSYGSPTYVKKLSSLLANGEYEKVLRTEVQGLQNEYDCDGIAGNLQQKYFDEVITCLIQYEKLFGIS